MIDLALDNASCTPQPSAGIGAEIDRREAWWSRYTAHMGRTDHAWARADGVRVHNWLMWRAAFQRALASVTRDAQTWMATRPAQNVTTMRRNRA